MPIPSPKQDPDIYSNDIPPERPEGWANPVEFTGTPEWRKAVGLDPDTKPAPNGAPPKAEQNT
uniref:Uncharacterized protein n=1 Tax=uncultured Caudovirales phage TaxID=2100421 RepID=A0A6J5LA81_9CAUD|nr:hypothetical protein UFOVP114_65 [uncultured Caudovirales phage]